MASSSSRDPGSNRPPRHAAAQGGGERVDLLLACSAGGHLLQMIALRECWQDFSRVWVTEDRSDAGSLLRDERVVHAHGPTDRSITKLLLNLVLAWRVVGALRPR